MNLFQSPLQAALSGALLAFSAALLYGLMFALLASLRVIRRITRALPPVERSGRLYLANVTSILITSLELAVLLGLLAALLQGLAWLAASGLAAVLRVPALPAALLIAALLVTLLHLALRRAPELLYAMLWRSRSAYLFWLGLPCLIFMILTAAAFA